MVLARKPGAKTDGLALPSLAMASGYTGLKKVIEKSPFS